MQGKKVNGGSNDDEASWKPFRTPCSHEAKQEVEKR
jgi:hypothetical protein